MATAEERLIHEFHRLPPVTGYLLWAYHRYLRDDGWEIHKHRSDGQYNSYLIAKAGDDRQFHFRWYKSIDPDAIFVYARSYNMGRPIAILESSRDVLAFVNKVKKGKKFQGIKTP